MICYRYRFTSISDKNWFNQELKNVVEAKLGTQYVNMLDADPPFVDFMRLVNDFHTFYNLTIIIYIPLKRCSRTYWRRRRRS